VKPLYHGFYREAWAITTAAALEFATRFSYEVPANYRVQEDDSGDITDLYGEKSLSSELRDGVGIVRISGPLVSNAGFLEKLFGAVAQQDIVASVSAMADKNPKAIILDWNSGGGTCAGTSEAASEVSKIAKTVPVFSYVEAGTCASAAYDIASSASAGIYATSSSQVGSIGVLMQTASIAEMLKAAGIDVRVFASAPLKATGNPTQPLSEAGAGYFQSAVNNLGADFVARVQKNRPRVKAEAFDGRMFDAKQAKSLGLIDGVVENINDVITMAGGSRSFASRSSAPSAPAIRSQFDFKPLGGRPGAVIRHTIPTLAKAMNATEKEAEAVLLSEKLPVLETDGTSFLIEVSAINRLSKRN